MTSLHRALEEGATEVAEVNAIDTDTVVPMVAKVTVVVVEAVEVAEGMCWTISIRRL